MNGALARVRELSPVSGLRRGSLGATEVTAQSAAVTAPSAAMATTPALVAASAGNGTMYSYLIALVVMLLVGYCVSQFARRMAAPGSLYTFTAKGLGPAAAIGAGVGLVIGYAVLAMATLLLAAWYLIGLAADLGLDYVPIGPVAAAIVLILGGAAVVLMLRGVAVSLRAALAAEIVAVVAIVVVLVVLLVRRDLSLTTDLLRATGSSAHGIGLGVALAITSFVGFESAAALGGEARRPLVSIPRAIGWTAFGAGLLYLLSAYTQLVGLSGSLAARATPLVDLADRTDATWVPLVLDLGIAGSGFACAMGAATALTRLLFSLAREQRASSPLGRTSRRHTPYVAVLASMAVIVVIPLILLAVGVSPYDGFLYLVTISTFGYMLAYVLVCLSLPAFLRRIGELSAIPVAAGVVASAILIGVFVAYVYPLPPAPYGVLFWIFAAVAAIAVAAYVWLARRHPHLAPVVGVYDEATRADLYDRWAS